MSSTTISTVLAVVAMGVSGVVSKKATLAKALADRLGWPFQEGDDLHPAANIAKMKAGIPLTDADRWPWLDAISAWIDRQLGDGSVIGVITCSALKRAYRERLDAGRPRVVFVFDHLDEDAAAARIAGRKGHFMPPSLLASQFADLQPPDPDEPVITVDGAQPDPRPAGRRGRLLASVEAASPRLGRRPLRPRARAERGLAGASPGRISAMADRLMSGRGRPMGRAGFRPRQDT